MAHQQADSAIDGRFFDARQRATIEAAMSRIIPTDDRAGAREANTIEFLDRYLSGLGFIYAKPDGSGFETLEGKRAEAWRQRIDILRATYIQGIQDLDRRSASQFGAEFARLTGEQQDIILADMERSARPSGSEIDEAQVTGAVSPPELALQQVSAEIELGFFSLLALHTRQGFYADPIYGGNKDHAGWRLIGFEGPDSLAETHAGRYSTLPFFAEQSIDWDKEKSRGREA